METNDIKHFIASCAAGSFNQAAAQAGLTPSAVSKAIRRIEDELRLKLFTRSGRNVKLSLEGEVFHRNCVDLMALYDRARLDLGGKNSSFKVRIASSQAVISRHVLPVMKTLRGRYPNVSFELVTDCTPQIFRRLSTREVDLVVTGHAPPKEFAQRELGTATFRVYASPSHPLAMKRGPVSMSELLSHGFVLPQDRLYSPANTVSSDGWRDDLHPRRVTFVVDSLKAIEEIVRDGLALCYLPDFLGKDLGFTAVSLSKGPAPSSYAVNLATRDAEESGWIKSLF